MSIGSVTEQISSSP